MVIIGKQHTVDSDLFQTIKRNLYQMSLDDYGAIGGTIIVILIAYFIVVPVYQKKIVLRNSFNVSRICLYLSIAAVPYVRYLVLHNHAYHVYQFTYRAQAATVMAICFITLEFISVSSSKYQHTEEKVPI